MKKLAFAAMVLTSVVLSGRAFARTFRIHGTICYHTIGNFGADYSQFGIHNISGSPLTVECPLPLDSPNSGPTPAVTQVVVKVYDRNTSADITCSLEEMDEAGNVMLSMPNQTNGGGPGSPAANMTFVPPAGASATSYWRLRCTLPGVQTAGAFSHLSTIVVNTNE